MGRENLFAQAVGEADHAGFGRKSIAEASRDTVHLRWLNRNKDEIEPVRRLVRMTQYRRSVERWTDSPSVECRSARTPNFTHLIVGGGDGDGDAGLM
jgi:hypothetical protein